MRLLHKKPSFKAGDAVVLASLFAVALGLMGGAFRSKRNTVFVRACGAEYEFDAAHDGAFGVAGALGTTRFEIKGGKVRVIDSPCPNKTCVARGFSEALVCLPNNVIIRCGGDFDAVAQ